MIPQLWQTNQTQNPMKQRIWLVPNGEMLYWKDFIIFDRVDEPAAKKK